jgi:hypothetical protein
MRTLREIRKAVSGSTGVTETEMRARINTPRVAVARNLYYWLGVREGYAPGHVGVSVRRSRATVYLQTWRFDDALTVGDRLSVDYKERYDRYVAGKEAVQ